jgi:hypothetical protein
VLSCGQVKLDGTVKGKDEHRVSQQIDFTQVVLFAEGEKVSRHRFIGMGADMGRVAVVSEILISSQ